ncbi:hypothetical protein [Nordella sp. HKS 07]|uniref:hypothetical protein n=1 Tax=Nordella sp. HKS 07 TaxID=2712222 RepID=UPI001FF03692|nr:hypothetical protein [Nordella sp. HKS 07]
MPLRMIAISIFVALLTAFSLEIAEGPVNLGFVSSAEAKVGRPLTPVSVAGVGRRTARRCAAGVYNC